MAYGTIKRIPRPMFTIIIKVLGGAYPRDSIGSPHIGGFSIFKGGRKNMKKKLLSALIILIIVSCSGCVSNVGEINKLSGDINQHLKKGDEYYNGAAEDMNNHKLDSALEQCESASSEYNAARLLTSETMAYAEESGDQVFIEYLELVLAEIDAKLNATSELKNAIQLLNIDETGSANNSLELANKFMYEAKDYERQRDELVSKNPQKFNI